MKLTAYLIGDQKAIIDISHPTEAELNGNAPLKWEATVSTGYADASSVLNIDAHSFTANAAARSVRDTYIDDYMGGWASLTDGQKKVLIRSHVWPNGTPALELDALYTAAERSVFRGAVIVAINREPGGSIIPSTVPGSSKYFCVTTDDSGVLITSEFQPHVKC